MKITTVAVFIKVNVTIRTQFMEMLGVDTPGNRQVWQ